MTRGPHASGRSPDGPADPNRQVRMSNVGRRLVGAGGAGTARLANRQRLRGNGRSLRGFHCAGDRVARAATHRVPIWTARRSAPH